MRADINSLLACALATALSAGCVPQPLFGTGDANQKLTVQTVQMADPVQTLMAALKRGDKRFLLISGFTESQSGAEYRPDAVNRYGTRTIEGTGDTISMRLQEGATDFAEIYNRLLIRHLIATGQISNAGPPPTFNESPPWPGHEGKGATEKRETSRPSP